MDRSAKLLLLPAAFAVLSLPACQAAGFDCDNVRTPREKLVCSHPNLSAAKFTWQELAPLLSPNFQPTSLPTPLRLPAS